MDPKTIFAAVDMIGNLNELAEASSNGFHPFSEVTPQNWADRQNGIVYLDDEKEAARFGVPVGSVIGTAIVDECHHDVLICWSKVFTDACGCPCEVTVQIPSSGKPYVSVCSDGPDGGLWIVEDGVWHNS